MSISTHIRDTNVTLSENAELLLIELQLADSPLCLEEISSVKNKVGLCPHYKRIDYSAADIFLKQLSDYQKYSDSVIIDGGVLGAEESLVLDKNRTVEVVEEQKEKKMGLSLVAEEHCVRKNEIDNALDKDPNPISQVDVNHVENIIGVRNVRKAFCQDKDRYIKSKTLCLILGFIVFLIAFVTLDVMYIKPNISKQRDEITNKQGYEERIKIENDLIKNLQSKHAKLYKKIMRTSGVFLSEGEASSLIKQFSKKMDSANIFVKSFHQTVMPLETVKISNTQKIYVRDIRFHIKARYETYRIIREEFMSKVKGIRVVNEFFQAIPNSSLIAISVSLTVPHIGE